MLKLAKLLGCINQIDVKISINRYSGLHADVLANCAGNNCT